jgi:hypothetical protein
MQGTLVFQPLLSPQVTIPTALSSASLAEPVRLIQSAINLTDKVLSLVSCSVSLHTRSAVLMPCYQHFLRPAQPIGPATRLSGSVSACTSPLSRITYHAVMSPIQLSVSIAPVLLVWQVTSGVTLACFGAIYPNRQDRTIRASPNDQ